MDNKDNKSILDRPETASMATLGAGAAAGYGAYNLARDYVTGQQNIENVNRLIDKFTPEDPSISDTMKRILIGFPKRTIQKFNINMDDGKFIQNATFDEVKQWLKDNGYESTVWTKFLTDHPHLATAGIISTAVFAAWLASKGMFYLYKKWRNYCNNN